MCGRIVSVLTKCLLQVGDGTSGTDRLTPADVVGLGSGVTNVAVGGVRLFAMRVCCCCFFGEVPGVRLRGLGCCGVLSLQLGWGGARGWLPVLVGVRCGVMRVREVGLMHGLQAHSCAVLSSGAVKCWGFNGTGQVILRVLACEGAVCVREDCFCADKVLAAGW